MHKKFKITLNSPVVLSIVFICFSVTLLGVITGDKSTKLLFMTYHSSLANPLTYLRFFLHIFGHRGWTHFMGNASYLLLLGPMLEEKYGSRTLIEVIALTAGVTGLVNYIFFWNVGICGASGVVFAFIILASFTGFNECEIPLTFVLVVLIYMGQQIFEGITVTDDISNTAHIVGGLIGAAVGYNFNKKLRFGV